MARELDRFAAELRPGALVLDLGAGPGFDSTELRSRGLRAVSLDYSLDMREAGLADFPGPRVQADMRCLPLPERCLDGVWACASLLHLPAEDALEGIRECHRVLRPGGVMFLSVRLGTGGEWESVRYGAPRWFEYWSAPDLDAALERCGFSTKESPDRQNWPSGWWLARIVVAEPNA